MAADTEFDAEGILAAEARQDTNCEGVLGVNKELH